MKKLLSLLFAVMAVGALSVGCSEDPPPPPHPIVGDWTMDAFDIVDVRILSGPYAETDPEVTVTFTELYGGIWPVADYYDYFFDEAIDAYNISFVNDNTFERRLGQLGPDIIDNGTWEIDTDITNIILDVDGGTFNEEYDFVGDILDTEMAWQERNVSPLFLLIYPDALLSDTLTDWSFQTQERVEAITAVVEFDVNYYFER